MRMRLVIITRNNNKSMYNLGEIKSRQFIRRPSIQPIVRTTSFHTIDNRRLTKIKNRESENQNVIDLANIMQQIREYKPKTAHRIDQNKNNRNRRVETIVPDVPKLKSKNNLVSIMDLLKQQREARDEFKLPNTLEERGEYKIDKRIVIERKSLDKNVQFKRNDEAHECHLNFQTIKFPQGVCKANDKKLFQKQKLEQQYQVEQQQGEVQSQQITKNMTEYGFKPQNKLTINNIDKLIFLNPKGKKSPKNTKKSDRDIIRLNPKQKLVPQNEQEPQQVVVPKQKRSIPNLKIPQFIKASLQAYKQQSEYGNFIISAKSNQNKTVGHREEFPPLPQRLQNIENTTQANDVQMGEKPSEQNLLTAKLNLQHKQKRRSNKIIDYIREKRQNNTIAVQTAKPIFKTSSRSKQKRNYLDDEFNHRICGWEESEPAAQGLADFKI